MMIDGATPSFVADEQRLSGFVYRVEENRGYEYEGALWTPGAFSLELQPKRTVSFIASAEPLERASALSPNEAQWAERERRRRLINAAPDAASTGIGAELVLAADQFIILPAGRVSDAVRAWAVGDEARTVIAGYHWFTDWGRDTMISLEGLTLVTRRFREAGAIIRSFAHHVHDGLIPNMFPDGSNLGLYHTADATLWFFHAIDRYVEYTKDRALLALLLPILGDIIAHHERGTDFGIGVDPKDGLLREGAEGYQLTWMDAKVGDWVVTPRRGKPVEINALWYNALSLYARWVSEIKGNAAAHEFAERALRVRESFNERFWYAEGRYLYDVVDGPNGDSTDCRPNQLFAISLPNAVLDREHWEPVMKVVREKLLTPVGLRSLAPGSKDYKPSYTGDLRARDAAYHQGTVWAWLIGAWIDAWLKLHPNDRTGARKFLDGVVADLGDFGVGSIAEIFDAEAPYTPRGCIAQAWSVAEALRCWVKTG
jgi:predicted glycogen debranching enzyme